MQEFLLIHTNCNVNLYETRHLHIQEVTWMDMEQNLFTMCHEVCIEKIEIEVNVKVQTRAPFSLLLWVTAYLVSLIPADRMLVAYHVFDVS